MRMRLPLIFVLFSLSQVTWAGSIIGENNLKLNQNTHGAVVAIVSGANEVICTGTAIGQNYVLTAAGCVFDIEKGHSKVNLSIIPYMNLELNQRSKERFFPKAMYIHKDFFVNAADKVYYENYYWTDFAVIELQTFEEAFRFNAVADTLPVRSEPPYILDGAQVDLIGYEEFFGAQTIVKECQIVETNVDNFVIKHNCDYEWSSYGAPLIKEGRIVAINTRKLYGTDIHRGLRIDLDILEDLQKLMDGDKDSLSLFTQLDVESSHWRFRTVTVTNLCGEVVQFSVRYTNLDGKDVYQSQYQFVSSGKSQIARVQILPYANGDSQTPTAIKLFAKTESGKKVFAGGNRSLQMTDGSYADHYPVTLWDHIYDPHIKLCE